MGLREKNGLPKFGLDPHYNADFVKADAILLSGENFSFLVILSWTLRRLGFLFSVFFVCGYVMLICIFLRDYFAVIC